MEHQYSTEYLRLEKQIGFPLYACAKEVVKCYRNFLDELDLTYTQYIAMMVFWEHGKLNVKELGEKLYLDSGTLTPMLKNLEAKGLVRRYRSTADERVLIVEITPEGEALKDKAVTVPHQVAECVDICKEDREELYRLLYLVLGQLRGEKK